MMSKFDNRQLNQYEPISFRDLFAGKQYILHIFVLLVLIIGAFSLSMNRPLGHDEHMYVSAGIMVADNCIYQDFSYLQTPYFPYMYRLVYMLVGESRLLLVSRLLSFGFFVVSLIFVYLICVRLIRDVFVALWGSCIFAFSHPIMFVIPYAWNHLAPLTFMVMALYFFVSKSENSRRQNLYYVLTGLLLGVAIGIKLTYALIPLGFLTALFFKSQDDRCHRRPIRDLFWLLLGLFFGLVPMFIIFIRAGHDLFIFNNWDYHSLNTIWRQTVGTDYSLGMTLAGKAKFVWNVVSYPTSVVLLISLFFTVAYQTCRRNSGTLRELVLAFATQETILFLICFLLAFLSSVLPTPLFLSYFVAPVPFAIFLLGMGLRGIEPKDWGVVRTFLIVLLLIGGSLGGVKLFRDIQHLTSVDHWTPIRTEQAAEFIYKNTRQFGDKPVIATLSPLFALEGKCSIYSELATGPFLYRVGDLLSDDQQKQYMGISPNNLGQFLTESPPDAILVGHEGSLDQLFIDYAFLHNYQQIEVSGSKLILYIKPDSSLR